MDTNNKNNFSIKLEEGDEKNDEQDEIRKYGKKANKKEFFFFYYYCFVIFCNYYIYLF